MAIVKYLNGSPRVTVPTLETLLSSEINTQLKNLQRKGAAHHEGRDCTTSTERLNLVHSNRPKNIACKDDDGRSVQRVDGQQRVW